MIGKESREGHDVSLERCRLYGNVRTEVQKPDLGASAKGAANSKKGFPRSLPLSEESGGCQGQHTMHGTATPKVKLPSQAVRTALGCELQTAPGGQ